MCNREGFFSINFTLTIFIYLKVKKDISVLSTEIAHIRSDIRELSEKVETKTLKPHVKDILLKIINYL